VIENCLSKKAKKFRSEPYWQLSGRKAKNPSRTLENRSGGRTCQILKRLNKFQPKSRSEAVRVHASPVAKKLAETLGIDLSNIAGTRTERAESSAKMLNLRRKVLKSEKRKGNCRRHQNCGRPQRGNAAGDCHGDGAVETRDSALLSGNDD
jgi:hypothetical protein